MATIASSTTPPGTPPQPVRRATKHKRVEYGRELQEKAAARRARRALAANEAKLVTVPKLKKVAKPTDEEKQALEAATLKASRTSQHRAAKGFVRNAGSPGTWA